MAIAICRKHGAEMGRKTEGGQLVCHECFAEQVTVSLRVQAADLVFLALQVAADDREPKYRRDYANHCLTPNAGHESPPQEAT